MKMRVSPLGEIFGRSKYNGIPCVNRCKSFDEDEMLSGVDELSVVDEISNYPFLRLT